MTYQKRPWGDLYTIKGVVNNWNKRYKTMRLCVSRPGLYAATLFREACQRQGITIQGKTMRADPQWRGKPLLHVKGEPLIKAIRFLNGESNNVVAGNINKLLATHAFPLPGTRAKGLAVIRDYCVSELGYEKGGFIIHDASGLDRKNRLSPAQFASALNHFYQKLGAVIFDVLPEQGNHPHARYPQPPRGIRAFVKSGTLPNTGVNTLVGYLKLEKTGQIFSFAILINRRGHGKPMYSGTFTNPILSLILKQLGDSPQV
jgi:PBP4 family serine-type D-alanyl-D-alanine carboxypeptidase